MKWTAEKEQKLRELYDADVPVSAIAKLLGCTRTAAKVRAHKLDLGDPERNQRRSKDAQRTGQAYRAGREARRMGGDKTAPATLTAVQRAWWLGGWHDMDMEMGVSVLEVAA